MNHFAIHLILTEHCVSTIFQLKRRCGVFILAILHCTLYMASLSQLEGKPLPFALFLLFSPSLRLLLDNGDAS